MLPWRRGMPTYMAMDQREVNNDREPLRGFAAARRNLAKTRCNVAPARRSRLGCKLCAHLLGVGRKPWSWQGTTGSGWRSAARRPSCSGPGFLPEIRPRPKLVSCRSAQVRFASCRNSCEKIIFFSLDFHHAYRTIPAFVPPPRRPNPTAQ